MEIRPFRAYRYAGDAARDVSAVVAPPYDQIKNFEHRGDSFKRLVKELA